MALASAALSYTEPGIVTILIFASFLLLLNAVNTLLDRTVYCGLVGQILLGVAWGVPGANWLPLEAQDTIMQLGYLGLILIVYEGGLATNVASLKANLFLSATVALVGISAPIGLSFALQGLLNVTPLQTFAAGAALCSTSLGTTFTVLTTSGLSESRLGVVLTSAAMMDDVVGLVMVQVISNLGGASTFSWVTVVRPIGVSVAFAVLLPLLCLWVVKPLTVLYYEALTSAKASSMHSTSANRVAALAFNTAVLLAPVTGSSYAGTSNLFAAYLAGACTSWLDELWSGLYGEQKRRAISPVASRGQGGVQRQSVGSASTEVDRNDQQERPTTGVQIYEQYCGSAVEAILKPFFFASIGFSIPISRMFEGGIIWRGFVYAGLMALGKLLCGLCLVSVARHALEKPDYSPAMLWPFRQAGRATKQIRKKTGTSAVDVNSAPPQEESAQKASSVQASSGDVAPDSRPPHIARAAQGEENTEQANTSRKRSALPKPRSLYPAAILGSAMMARGEIGFLISSVAESNGIYGSGTGQGTSELFLVVTWAILLCTIVGPVTVGLLVKRVKRLQALERRDSAGRDDPLGIWGLIPTA
ncbi:hypothetical protein LTR85_011386 [Meristemomyces frigidus]|nr:hypothetical protein LTR85_011386 [Meristemomyces frigidus]